MWSDELDMKIKEATEGNHPAYDDKAWDKMEVLLDKHLPLEKKRRRFIFLISLLLVGTGIFFTWQKSGKNVVSEEKNTGIQSKSINKQPGKGSDIAISSKNTTPLDAAVPGEQVIIKTAPGKTNPNEKNDHAPQFEPQQLSRKQINKPKANDQENIFAGKKQAEANDFVTGIDKNSVDNRVEDVSSTTPVPLTQQDKIVEEKKHADLTEANDTITAAKPAKQGN